MHISTYIELHVAQRLVWTAKKSLCDHATLAMGVQCFSQPALAKDVIEVSLLNRNIDSASKSSKHGC